MTSAIEAYPLCWPDGWPRRESWQREDSAYQVEFARARDDLVRELRLARARDVVISSNGPLRRDGLPLANMAEPKDPGVAVYWTDRKGLPRVIAFDRHRRVRENLRAVGTAIESIRSLERTGAELLERAFAGFARLPETAGAGDHWTTLGIARGASADELSRRYRELAREHHPDRGGNPATMVAINDAYRRASAEVGA
jgi:hypothetical protein